MPDQLFIEPATVEDLPQLADLLYGLFSQETDFIPNRDKQMRGLRLILEQPNRGRIFVLRSGSKIIGMINLLITISTAEGGFVLILEDLVIHCDHRGQGYGGRLVEHALGYARAKGFLRVTLLTDKLENRAHAFYEHHGFHKSGMVPMRYYFSTQDNADTPPLTGNGAPPSDES
ncbi:MAG: GNAT family N-acetyltransferase [Verrucomicrobiota bacterium]|jgi:GNAT superfamily N-acetyltransferase